jgi:hypothetical protein
MDEELVRGFWRLMEDRDVNEFVLAVFVEWVRRRRKERLRGSRGRLPIKTPYFSQHKK